MDLAQVAVRSDSRKSFTSCGEYVAIRLSNRELYVSPIVYCTLVFISFNVAINHYSMPLGYDVGPPVDETIISIQLAGGSIFQYILPPQGNMCEAICIKLVGFMVLNLTGIGQNSGCNLPKGLFFADVLASLARLYCNERRKIVAVLTTTDTECNFQ